MINANDVVGNRYNVLFVTFDSLRYDVACISMRRGRTPNLARVVPACRWEERCTHATFTLPAHQAFFSGFMPVPAGPKRHPRLFACRAIRGTTITGRTHVFNVPNIIAGFSDIGYRTVCVGGVDFFSRRTEQGCVLPGLFEESCWAPDMSADVPNSTSHQVDLALKLLEAHRGGSPIFLFLNVSATHVPHGMYARQQVDSRESQLEALAYADGQLGRLFRALSYFGPWLLLMCADHGDAYGEDGFFGHGVAHPTVWSVPYMETILQAAGPSI